MSAVVVGYIAKPEGEAALAKAIEEATLRGVSLVVVNSHRGGPGFDEQTAGESDSAMASVRARLDESGVSYEIKQLVRGFEPSEDLIKIAQDCAAGLIVIGLRRRTPVGKLILGSNAQRILLDASCPVLAVKAAD